MALLDSRISLQIVVNLLGPVELAKLNFFELKTTSKDQHALNKIVINILLMRDAWYFHGEDRPYTDFTVHINCPAENTTNNIKDDIKA